MQWRLTDKGLLTNPYTPPSFCPSALLFTPALPTYTLLFQAGTKFCLCAHRTMPLTSSPCLVSPLSVPHVLLRNTEGLLKKRSSCCCAGGDGEDIRRCCSVSDRRLSSYMNYVLMSVGRHISVSKPQVLLGS